MLSDIPEGAVCYLDATIFYYHLVGAPTLSDECSDLLKRIELGHHQVVATARGLRLSVEAITLDLLARGAALSIQERLLTNDALTLAVMEQLGVTILATNDDDFDAVTGITVYKPLRA